MIPHVHVQYSEVYVHVYYVYEYIYIYVSRALWTITHITCFNMYMSWESPRGIQDSCKKDDLKLS